LFADYFPPGLSDTVELSCKATIGGETVYVRQLVPAAAYDDPEAREVIEQGVRQQLMLSLLDKFKPKIIVRR
jgi:hypothetical protein